MIEEPLLKVRHLKKQYGEGCSVCKNGESNELREKLLSDMWNSLCVQRPIL